MNNSIDSTLEALSDVILRNHKANGSVLTKVPNLYLVRQGFVSAPKHFFHKPSLCVITQGKKVMCLQENNYVYSTGDYLLSSMSLPLTGEVVEASHAKPYLSVKIEFDMKLLMEVMTSLKLGNDATCECDSTCPSIEVGRLDESLMESIYRLCSLVDYPEDIEFLAKPYTKEVYYRLLKGKLGSLLTQFAVKGKATVIRDIVKEITDNFAEPLTLEKLAEKYHISLPTLHRHFKHFTDMSPIQFQKTLRLQQARQLMLNKGANVSTAAFEVGYESASQFSREYLRMYGLSPKDDIKQLRATLA